MFQSRKKVKVPIRQGEPWVMPPSKQKEKVPLVPLPRSRVENKYEAYLFYVLHPTKQRLPFPSRKSDEIFLPSHVMEEDVKNNFIDFDASIKMVDGL